MKIPHVCPQKFQISPNQSLLNRCPQIFPQVFKNSQNEEKLSKSGNTDNEIHIKYQF